MLPIVQIDGDITDDDRSHISNVLSDTFTIVFTSSDSDRLQRIEEKLDLLAEDVSQILLANRGITPKYTVGTGRM
jgi:hypothetical protein